MLPIQSRFNASLAFQRTCNGDQVFRKLIVLVVVLIQMSAKYLLPLLLKIHVYFAKILVGNCLGGNLTREPNSIPVRQFGYPATTFTDLAT